MNQEKNKTAVPQMSPYIFTILLIGFGLWCFWDGWLTTDPEMLKHATFNRVLSIILLSWGVYDFYKLRKKHKDKKEPEDKL
jgi:hypothetical protein